MRPTAKAKRARKDNIMTTTTSSFVSASNTTIATPKFFRFNMINDTIEGSEFNFKKAGNPASEQYAELMQFKAIQPSFKFAPIASTKKVEKKQTYKGLNTKMMSDYIALVGTDVQKETIKHMVDKKVAYPTMKSWFLEEFKGFNVNKANTMIAKGNLNAKKATVRKVVKANMAKAAEAKATTVVELPTASNF